MYSYLRKIFKIFSVASAFDTCVSCRICRLYNLPYLCLYDTPVSFRTYGLHDTSVTSRTCGLCDTPLFPPAPVSSITYTCFLPSPGTVVSMALLSFLLAQTSLLVLVSCFTFSLKVETMSPPEPRDGGSVRPLPAVCPDRC